AGFLAAAFLAGAFFAALSATTSFFSSAMIKA
ncbi:MAG: hypothetical protein ACI857_002491, partial [Arenicella sp.]